MKAAFLLVIYYHYMNARLFKSIIVLAVFLIGLFYLYTWGVKNKKVEQPLQKDEQHTGVQIEDQVYKTPNSYSVLNIVYPKFTGVDPQFNKKIEDFVQARIAEHIANAQGNWQARHDTDPDNFPAIPQNEQDKFQFFVKYDISQVNDRSISILLRYGGYEGGAHGYENLEAFNYDVVAQKELFLKDFFPNDPQYLVTVSKYTRDALVAQFKKQALADGATETNWKDAVSVEMINEGTSPNLANFATFTFSDEALIFHFPEYQVAPYVMGEQQVVMPRGKK